jgi:hypothetical protein
MGDRQPFLINDLIGFGKVWDGLEPWKSGTAGTRTQDQSLKRALLYQLSYRPDQARIIAELKPQITGISRGVPRGIGQLGGGESGGPQAAGIAFPAGGALRVGLITRHRHAEIHAQFAARPDDIGLG